MSLGGATMAKNRQIRNDSFVLFSLDELLPHDHLVRDLEEFIDWDFIYSICDPLYSDFGANRVNPSVLFKLMMINIILGIHSMCKTCEEVQVNIAYRWFLGLSFEDKVPNHSTFSQNYIRKFRENDVAIKIFMHIIEVLKKEGVIDLTTVYTDGTHLKANANKNKYENKEVEIAAKIYQQELNEEIDMDREKHHKKQLKKKEEKPETKNIKTAKNDPDCGYFHKGEKERCFAYNVNTSCDKNGYILAMYVEPGNVHDSQAFFGLYGRLKCWYGEAIKKHVADAGYISPAISKLIKDNEQTLYIPYKRPMTKKGFFKKYEYVYDEYYDCYLCPNGKVLNYRTTTREGYKEYVSNPKECKDCPLRRKCTESKNQQKVIQRHVWEEYKEEFMEEVRHSPEWKEIYPKRKETIERVFADGKRRHGLDYTLYTGKEAVEFHTLMIYTGMNIKKYAKYMKKIKEKCAQKSGYRYRNEEVEEMMRLLG